MKDSKKSVVANELIYGAHPIAEALKAGQRKLISIFTTKPLPKAWDRIKNLLPQRPVNTQYVSREILTRMTGSSDHMGIAAWFSPFPFRKNMFTPDKMPMILLLDGVQDVRNLGAILRSAYCTGIDGVVLCKGHAAPLTPAAIKASAGLAEHLAIHVAPSLGHAINEIKKNGYNMYAAVLDGKDARTVTFNRPTCLIIGNEETGLSAAGRSAGEAITLPQRTPDISYNASVAAGILMFLVAYKQ